MWVKIFCAQTTAYDCVVRIVSPGHARCFVIQLSKTLHRRTTTRQDAYRQTANAAIKNSRALALTMESNWAKMMGFTNWEGGSSNEGYRAQFQEAIRKARGFVDEALWMAQIQVARIWDLGRAFETPFNPYALPSASDDGHQDGTRI